MNKQDRKYLKTALRMLRQGNSMLLNLSKKTDIDVISIVTANMHDGIEKSLKQANSLKDYITGQMSLKFDEETN